MKGKLLLSHITYINSSIDHDRYNETGISNIQLNLLKRFSWSEKSEKMILFLKPFDMFNTLKKSSPNTTENSVQFLE